jgi:CRISPR-associated endonuclease/helicase Cas3
MTPSTFTAFYQAIHGSAPFPWQVRLVQRLLADDWPRTLALPTSSGKTSVLDGIVFALAMQADRPARERTIPLRTCFVIDRRLVVDEVTAHAQHLAQALATATHGVVVDVADRLRQFGGAEPLQVATWRGGMAQDEEGLLWPHQPALLISTVDQVGSRLLFRGYGLASYQWPVHAGLLGNDTLFVLDEVHLAQPFVETLQAIRQLRGWAEQPLHTPWRVLAMSATPLHPEGVFTLEADDDAHPVLQARLYAAKMTRLLAPRAAVFVDTLVSEARHCAQTEDVQVIGVVVNRVDTARAVFEQLRGTADAILLTGRTRPADRDQLLQTWLPQICAGRTWSRPGPLFVVATQTIEVGANLDFNALVTEAAPLAALRQRFGRLDRLGRRGRSEAVIVLRQETVDPVYQDLAQATFRWLQQHVMPPGPPGALDFGSAALAAVLARVAEPPPLMPMPSAPVLLPSLLEQWVQTSPVPHPDPDVAPFLHGPQPVSLDVQVVWRADLVDGEEDQWADTVALLPPTIREALPVPLHAVRAWLRANPMLAVSDLEGTAAVAGTAHPGGRQVLCWRGSESALMTADAAAPGDTLVVPASWGGADSFGWHPTSLAPVEDVAEACQMAFPHGQSRRLRLHPRLLAQWDEADERNAVSEALTTLCQTMTDPDADDVGTAQTALLAACASRATQGGRDPRRIRVLPYPGERPVGVVLVGDGTWPVTDDDDTSCLTRPVPLLAHLEGVAAWSRRLASGCGLPEAVVHDVALAGALHDLGKVEPRFQVMLHAGNALAAATAPEPLAKSGMAPGHWAALRRARERAGVPAGFRHEFVSVALLDAEAALLVTANDPTLVRYLVGVHHGRGRPFPPVVPDPAPQRCVVQYKGYHVEAESDHGLARLERGWAETFWQLHRRYGYWGLAYLEALLRLGDRACSQEEMRHG